MRIAGVLLSGVLAGCGAAVLDEENEALASREDALPWCDNNSYSYHYYSDDTYRVLVGYEICTCFAPMRWGGRATAFIKVISEGFCEDPPENPWPMYSEPAPSQQP
nr:hypothetical protein MFMH1_50120 [Myxococcus sp. MH1]